jgi:hypothetical protein
LPRGIRVGPAEVGLLAAVGAVLVEVYQLPKIALLSTGDEVRLALLYWFLKFARAGERTRDLSFFSLFSNTLPPSSNILYFIESLVELFVSFYFHYYLNLVFKKLSIFLNYFIRVHKKLTATNVR